MTLDATQRSQLIERIVREISHRYLDPPMAAEIDTAIRARLKTGAYQELVAGVEFADRLGEDLRAIGSDRLLAVIFHDAPRPPDPPDLLGKFVVEPNFGFARAALLDGNIGHLVLHGFAPADIRDAAEIAIAAMTFLARSDALVLDLRENCGGSPSMVTLLASFLFDRPVHLATIAGRPGEPETQHWTYDYLPAPRFRGPVYVLTSQRSFGAAEQFAARLQSLGRAIVVGERTIGVGRLGRPFWVDAHFDVWIPTGRAIDPATNADWHGTGVTPDIEVAASDALTAARRLARESDRMDSKDERDD